MSGSIDLKTRAREPELMDDPAVDPAELDLALEHLEAVNRWLNGYEPSIAGIRRLLPLGTTSFSLLDVGCGSGDTMRQIAAWARREKLEVRLTGIELSAQSAHRAAVACQAFPEITIRHQDIFNLPPDETFDITHCALVLHHFSDDASAAALLQRMGQAARHGVVINDLHRHPLAYHSIKWLTRGLSTSRVLRNDAPLSVARAFTGEELLELASQAQLTDVDVKWHWAFRWLMTAQSQG
jgi:SAM-dependent methyltransferase